MKYYFIFFTYLFTTYSVSFGQQWSDSTIAMCNTANKIGYLTQEEKAVIFYINLVRVDPKLFAQTYLKTYIDTASIKKTKYLESLKNELNKMKGIAPIEPQFDLFEVAKKHAIEMGNQGKTGHVSLSGENYESRAMELSLRYEKAMENCQYGYSDGLSIVIDLLIDEEIPDVSHRKSLLNPEVKYIGAAIRKHKVYRYNCVIELGYKLKN
ncbi:MAG TPA: CAP domain-containing protein [Bacteroidia bacterium]|nr:CAP domain-containing protein [Bacteroidia bacterium]